MLITICNHMPIHVVALRGMYACIMPTSIPARSLMVDERRDEKRRKTSGGSLTGDAFVYISFKETDQHQKCRNVYYHLDIVRRRSLPVSFLNRTHSRSDMEQTYKEPSTINNKADSVIVSPSRRSEHEASSSDLGSRAWSSVPSVPSDTVPVGCGGMWWDGRTPWECY